MVVSVSSVFTYMELLKRNKQAKQKDDHAVDALGNRVRFLLTECPPSEHDPADVLIVKAP